MLLSELPNHSSHSLRFSESTGLSVSSVFHLPLDMSLRLFLLALLACSVQPTVSFRTWVCYDNKCVKEETKNQKDAMSIRECKARCLKYGGLWPKPTGSFFMGNRSSNVDVSAITFEKHEYPENINRLLRAAQENFLERVKHDKGVRNYSAVDVLNKVIVRLEVYDPSVVFFTTNTDESYRLTVTPARNNSDAIKAKIEANTFFGLRHGLETLSQLFFYDDLHQVYKMVDEVIVEDKPVFTHRGIVVDTARSYITKDNLMKMLNVMAANKLNTFHWHITDSQSFPYVSAAYPQLSKQGAYSERQVYNQSDIKKIVEYAQGLGIRVIPEFDAPAHVGEGWSALGEDLVTCFKWQPWRDYCVEPPCGQLDPTNEKVYDILGTIFKEYVELFNSDLFHMGGDEVNLNCWRATPRINEWMDKHNYPQTNTGYYRLWGDFQEKALKKLRATRTDPHPQAILWTSTLTEPSLIGKYLRPEDYIIQIWTLKMDPTIRSLIENKFRIILSNYDELYFDCGGPTWVGYPGQNWCSPYIGWQFVYRHSPYQILQGQGIKITDDIKKLVLGSESAIWTEQIDNHNLHTRLWPRAAALGERLWSDPKEDWSDAQFRMNHHRERLSNMAPAELLQPQWCYQNDGFCD